MTNAYNDIPHVLDWITPVSRSLLAQLDACGCTVHIDATLAQSTVTGGPWMREVTLVEAIAWLVTVRVAQLVLERQEGLI